MYVAEAAANRQHLLGRLQDGEDLIPALIRLEDHRTPEDRVLVEELGHPIEVASLDGSTEAIGEHRAQTNAPPARYQCAT
jgi:hypothetical protein